MESPVTQEEREEAIKDTTKWQKAMNQDKILSTWKEKGIQLFMKELHVRNQVQMVGKRKPL